MIKKTFYNLPKEKQERIVNAVRKEFSKEPQEKASINRIIKEANISRGSFYQYFDDKVDLIELLVGDLFSQISNYYIELLSKNDGNIFTVSILLYDKTVELIDEKGDADFVKNILSGIRVNSELVYNYLYHRFSKENATDKIREIIKDYINPKYLNCKDFEEIVIVVEIIHMVIQGALVDVFARKTNKDKARETMRRKIELLKKGFDAKNL